MDAGVKTRKPEMLVQRPKKMLSTPTRIMEVKQHSSRDALKGRRCFEDDVRRREEKAIGDKGKARCSSEARDAADIGDEEKVRQSVA